MPDDFDFLVKGKKVIPKEELRKETYPSFFKFDRSGDWIAGVLSEPREIEQQDGRTSRVMTITTEQGQSHSIGLTSALSGLWDMVGKKVSMRFTGMEKNGSFYQNNFDVVEL